MESKNNVIKNYIVIVENVFDTWFYDADEIIRDYIYPRALTENISTRASKSFARCHLKRIEQSINNLKVTMRILCEMHAELDKEFDQNFFTFKLVTYACKHHHINRRILQIANKISSVAKSYERIFEKSRYLDLNIDDIVSVKNQENIKLLLDLSDKDFTDLLNSFKK
jgi:hypothetical protein